MCFFVASGSEANDLALRLARAATGREGVMVLADAYHGHTQALIDVSMHDGPGGSGAPPHVTVTCTARSQHAACAARTAPRPLFSFPCSRS